MGIRSCHALRTRWFQMPFISLRSYRSVNGAKSDQMNNFAKLSGLVDRVHRSRAFTIPKGDYLVGFRHDLTVSDQGCFLATVSLVIGKENPFGKAHHIGVLLGHFIGSFCPSGNEFADEEPIQGFAEQFIVIKRTGPDYGGLQGLIIHWIAMNERIYTVE
jgi:hypothetical protein